MLVDAKELAEVAGDSVAHVGARKNREVSLFNSANAVIAMREQKTGASVAAGCYRRREAGPVLLAKCR